MAFSRNARATFRVLRSVMWLLFGNANLRFEIGPSPDALPHDSAYVVSVMASDVAVANGSQDGSARRD
jgi:hypothetical protein